MDRLLTVLVALALLGACGAGPAEHQLVGTWAARTSTARLTVLADRRFTFAQPDRATIVGRYRVLGAPTTLAGTQFDLAIHFTIAGDAFTVSSAGAGGSEQFVRVQP